MVDCVWMRDWEGDVRKRINQDIPQVSSHHAMSWKTLSMECQRGQKHLGVGFEEGVAVIASAVLLFLQEQHWGKQILMTSIVVCSFNRKKRLSNRNSFTKRVKNEMINVINEKKMSKSKCQKLIIKCYW